MKKFALLLSFLFVAGLAAAEEKKAEATKAPAKAATTKVHDVNGEFVSADLVKKTVTIKLEGGEESTAPLEGKAVAEAKDFKAGQKIVVSCKDDANGKHLAAVAIKPAPVAPPEKK